MGREGRALAIGLVLGLAGAAWAGRLLSGFLYGVEPVDPVSVGAAVLLLGLTGLTGSWLAARRGTALDPLEAIRVE